MTRRPWSRSELIVAFNLYCKLRFGQYHSRNPSVVALASAIGRTPDAVAMKLCNFAACDPTHQWRGVKGLANYSKADGAIYTEFVGTWSELAAESERSYQELLGLAPDRPSDNLEFTTPSDSRRPETEVDRMIKARLGQDFFRAAVLAAYDYRCCVCDLPCPSLLVASHIVPWAKREALRVDPRNGLALCALHDRAFDRGLIGIDDGNVVLLSPRLRDYLPHSVLERMFVQFEGAEVHRPEKFGPLPDYLAFHRSEVFQRSFSA